MTNPPIQTLDDYIPGVPVRNTVQVLHKKLISGEPVGAVAQAQAWYRPRYRFQIEYPLLTEAELCSLYGFVHHHKTDKAFWYSGGDYGDIQNPISIGYGDGAIVDFFLPNNYLTNGTVSAFVEGSPATITTTVLETGMIRLASAPAINEEVTVTYQCSFLCVFEMDNNKLMTLNPFMARAQGSSITADTETHWRARFVIRETGNALRT